VQRDSDDDEDDDEDDDDDDDDVYPVDVFVFCVFLPLE